MASWAPCTRCPRSPPSFQSIGLDLRQLRPIHTAFASAWIFLGGVAVVHRWLQDHGGVATVGDRWRLRVQVASWAIAGTGILLTLAMGIGSGREYVGFHPVFSVFILIGWICYAWNFFRVAGPRLLQQAALPDDVGRRHAPFRRHVRGAAPVPTPEFLREPGAGPSGAVEGYRYLGRELQPLRPTARSSTSASASAETPDTVIRSSHTPSSL